MEWIDVNDRLPEKFEATYPVVTISLKTHINGDQKGQGIITIVQDWVVRLWTKNFTHWMPLPELPK